LQRGLHNIEDEIVFSNHTGYVFHDSRGFEAGSDDELRTVQGFVVSRLHEKRLNERLHAIWFVPLSIYLDKFTRSFFRYCVPMDNDRPELDLRHFDDICPDKNGMSKYNTMNED
jgi:hypothetical protein